MSSFLPVLGEKIAFRRYVALCVIMPIWKTKHFDLSKVGTYLPDIYDAIPTKVPTERENDKISKHLLMQYWL